MSNRLARRKFMKLAGMVSVGFAGFHQCVNKSEIKVPSGPGVGYGQLLPDARGILNLPEGFDYKIISTAGDIMSDGFTLPGQPDGMAAFNGPEDYTIVIRNHELSPGNPKLGPWGENNALLSQVRNEQLYDYGRGSNPGLGGTTTFLYNEKSQEIEKQYLSLAGTIRNCAGGPTPWNSWISCEETVQRANDTLEKDHGYIFEVPVSADIHLLDPKPLKAMGRFNHEAVCVDPNTGIVYLTEDREDGLIYRFIPNEKGQLDKGGRLQVLAVKDHKSFDTRNWKSLETPKIAIGEKFTVQWMDIDNVESPDDDLRFRGFEQGATRFARGEGMWFGDRELYFTCTNGGHEMKGQVFRYVPGANEGMESEEAAAGTLELFAEPNNTSILNNGDNLTIAPWGDVIICEDNPNPSIVGITPAGEIYQFCKNIGYSSEFAGATFSPSGKTLFVNIQDAGVTLAITGPWHDKLTS